VAQPATSKGRGGPVLLYLFCLGLFTSVAVLSGIMLGVALLKGDKAQAWIWSALCASSVFLDVLLAVFFGGLV
jgi:hypothetical protein